MPWNGSGVFARLYSWVADDANGIDILASRMDGDTNDIAAGLMHCLTVNGETVPTANLTMNNFRITNLADGVGANDAVTFEQLTGGGAAGSFATLTVSGNATCNQGVTVGNGLTVDNGINLASGGLSVTGGIDVVSGDLDVGGGNITAAGAYGLAGCNVYVGQNAPGALYIYRQDGSGQWYSVVATGGYLQFNSSVGTPATVGYFNYTGDFTVAGNLSANNLTASGGVSVDGALSVSGALSVGGTATLAGVNAASLSLSGALSVGGSTTLAGASASSLNVTGTLAAGALNVSGNIATGGVVFANDPSHVFAFGWSPPYLEVYVNGALVGQIGVG